MEHILNIYEGGVCGVWVNWLVNQHHNFPIFDKFVHSAWNVPVQVDLICPGSDWDSDTTNFGKWLMKYGANKTASKRCIRYQGLDSDHGFSSSNGTFNAEVFTNVLLQTQIKKIIVAYTVPTDEYYSRLAYRWAYIKEGIDGDQKTSNFEELCDSVLNSYTHYANQGFGYYNAERSVFDIVNASGAEYLYLNVSKLIAGDNNEYSKLLTFIDEEPLHNYIELAREYRKFMFDSFGSIMDIVENDENFYTAAKLVYRSKSF